MSGPQGESSAPTITISGIRVSPDRTASPSTTHVSSVSLVAAVIGLGLLVVTIRQVGWADIREGLRAVGGGFVVVLALGGLRFLARAVSWRTCAAQVGAPGLPLGGAFGAVIASDAVGNLTPLGLLASEPAKVLLVRRHVPTDAGVTSVALDNVFYTLSVVVMLAVGAWLLVRQVALPPGLHTAAEAVLAGVAAGGVALGWLALRRPALVSWATMAATRITGRQARTADRLLEIERRFYGALSWPAAPLARVAAMQVLFHVGAVLEVWLILSLLAGQRTPLASAFVLESTGRLITVLFKVVPFRMGVDEVGAAAVAGAIGVPVSHGVSLALIRKLRILLWNGAGLVVLARTRR